jgi:hypothetical protein
MRHGLIALLDVHGAPVVRAWNVVHTRSKLLSPAAESFRYFMLEHGEAWLAQNFGALWSPPAAAEVLNKALRAALNDAVLKAKLEEIGAEVPAAELQTAAGLRTFIGSEITRWTPIIQAAGVTIQ